MEQTDGLFGRIALAMAGKKSPWGGSSGDGGNSEEPAGQDASSGDEPAEPGETPPRGPRNPWLPGGAGNTGGTRRGSNVEDLFRKRGGGPGGSGGGSGINFQMPRRSNGKSWLPVAAAAVVGLWIVTSSTHFIQPREQAIVNWLGGKFSTTLSPGTNFTLPWPIQQVDVEDVSRIRSENIPDGTDEKLILTSDQNLVDLSYLVRWNVNDLTLFRYQLADPQDTLREVAEASMRAAVARQELDSVLSGAGRAEVEQEVLANLQTILDAYKSGISVQGVSINKVDPPARVEEAFKDVSSAQQDADTSLNRARAYAQQVLARAQGDAAQFDRLYEQYRLAPGVTRQRLYYETMESVLARTDKTIVEGGGNVTPYLPLPEIRRRAAENAAPAGAPAVRVQAPQGGQ